MANGRTTTFHHNHHMRMHDAFYRAEGFAGKPLTRDGTLRYRNNKSLCSCNILVPAGEFIQISGLSLIAITGMENSSFRRRSGIMLCLFN